MNITIERKRYLSAVVGRPEYREEYVKDLVKDCDNQLTIEPTIAKTKPQAAYSAFACGFKNKLNYFVRTISNIRHLLLPLESTIKNNFIPAVTGGHICSDKERVLISLPTRYGGLAIPIFHETGEIEFMNSSKITSELTPLIIQQCLQCNIHENILKKLKTEVKESKEENYKNKTSLKE